MPPNRHENEVISNGDHYPAADAVPPPPTDKKLFTPGPMGVSLTTKQAMLRDVGSRDVEFVNIVRFIRQRLLQVAGKMIDLPACYFVDAMSSFGAVPLDLIGGCVDFMVSSANKCIEGVPGFAYTICRTDRLLSYKGVARSLTLDLVEQYLGLEKDGQFRFTPPTHVILAFCQALCELEQEGGVQGRAKRYQANHKVLQHGMAALGFKELLDETHDGYIVTSYRFPDHPAFSFEDFYSRLNEKGQAIHPKKGTKADSFRVATIGHLFPEDMQHLLHCIQEVCADMGIPLPMKQFPKKSPGKQLLNLF
ncbi:2-aminoethylphosphonate--pyruvate transaminase-like [Branchiostoma floridae]|uniref:2-aminoethylphosphonate--pyruvate transaminase-like n=1 Tax=Branchiostoma floridae TaxID=7739 RepID=A0A9J7M385_BRAFL|nr:2-aminoethylphosphonate--pyruvate transaminase-like [Branchiostoma floridae]